MAPRKKKDASAAGESGQPARGPSVCKKALLCLYRAVGLRRVARWRNLVTGRMILVPALGLATTAALIVLVNVCAIGTFEVPKFAEIKVRIVEGNDKKDKDKKPVRLIEDGTLKDKVDEYKKRKTTVVDLQSRELAFLTIWGVTNLIQGGLVVVVLVLSFRTIFRFWSCHKNNELLVFSFLILSLTLATLGILERAGVTDITLRHSFHGQLDQAMRDLPGQQRHVEVVTGFGNLTIGLVTLFAPFALCVLLRSSAPTEQRFEALQHLMYWTALLLVAGVAQVTYQSRWPGLFFDDEFNIQQIAQTALSRGMLVGGCFSVALALVFLPVGYLLGPESLAANKDPAAPAPATKSWFTEIFAVFAPVVTALPIGKLFEMLL